MISCCLFIIDSCNPNQDTVRLINGTNPTEGKQEVCGMLMAICDNNFDSVD